jgi:SAM-dependent methyltransferase
MDSRHEPELIRSYDRVAEEYAAQLAGELTHKPFDREWLDRFAARVRDRGLVCDVGCGPGHVAGYLHTRGVDVFGIDLAPGMVEVAQRLHPAIAFRVGDMCALDVEDGAWAGIVAFYAIVHLQLVEITPMLRELRRVLQPEGILFLAFHAGSGVVHRDELFGQPVQLDFRFFERWDIEVALTDAGFDILESVVRPPYPDVEYPSHRAYILAQVQRRHPT